jgi:enoyl-CoA hydratase/carnithine racemase
MSSGLQSFGKNNIIVSTLLLLTCLGIKALCAHALLLWTKPIAEGFATLVRDYAKAKDSETLVLLIAKMDKPMIKAVDAACMKLFK